MPSSPHPIYPHLFSGFELAGKTLRNRIAHASMTTRFGVDQRATDRLIAYGANRAKGGAAMIITEPLSATPWQQIPYKPCIFNDDHLDSLQKWAEAVESQDCRLLGQLQDSGRGSHHRGRVAAAIGASSLPDDLSWRVPRELRADEIKWMNEQMAASSARLKRAGFSGVEISGGHGHLFHQFLSPRSNIREDEYGSDLEGRTRQLRELVAAIRSECGVEFIVGLRLPGDDGMPGGIDANEAERIVRRISADANIDYLCFVQGAHGLSLEMHIPDMHEPRATYLPLIHRLRQAAGGIPVMAVGLITDPNEAERALADETAELIGLGRPLVTDAAWPIKSEQGREAEIRYCVSCNSCWALIAEQQPLACDNNPRVGAADEADWHPKRLSKTKRIVVVGAGVAGMEAAWVAAARGHDVTVFGSSPEAGGKTRIHAALPGGENLSSVYDYQFLRARKEGVRMELGFAAQAEDVLMLEPDEIILATGATMMWPTCLPDEFRDDGVFLDLRSLIPQLLTHTARFGGTAVVYDCDQTAGTYDTVMLMLKRVDHVAIITPREELAHEESIVARQGIFRRLLKNDVHIIPFSEISTDSDFIEGQVTYRNVVTGRASTISDVSLLTYSTPRIPNVDLLAPLRAAGHEPHLIGDCLSPRYLMSATQDGHAIGNAI